MKKVEAEILEKRLETFRRALSSDPDDDVALYGLGRALLQLERYPEAERELRRLVELRPGYTAAHRELGRALLLAGKAKDAREALVRGCAVAEETGDLQAGREMGVLLQQTERKLEEREKGKG